MTTIQYICPTGSQSYLYRYIFDCIYIYIPVQEIKFQKLFCTFTKKKTDWHWQSERTRTYLPRNRLKELGPTYTQKQTDRVKELGHTYTQKQTDRVKELGLTYPETDWQSERTQNYLLRNRLKDLGPTYPETDWQSERTRTYLLRNKLTEWKNSDLLTLRNRPTE